jgi:hypothetical protein
MDKQNKKIDIALSMIVYINRTLVTNLYKEVAM